MSASLLLSFAGPALAHEEPGAQVHALSEAIASSPGDAGLLLRRAALYLLDHEWDAAGIDLDRAERIAPGLDGVAVARAQLHLGTGDPARAVASANQHLARHPGSAEALRLRARAHLALGDANAAVRDLGAAIDASPRPAPEIYIERANAILTADANDAHDALRTLDEGEERLGVSAPLSLRAIEIELARGDTAAARRRADRLDEAPSRAVSAGSRMDASSVSVAAPGAQSSAADPVFVPAGAVWRYNATGTDLGIAWRDPAYDDAALPAGAAPLGYGEPYIVTTIPSGSPARYPTSYFRTEFTLLNATIDVGRLTLRANYDDGFVAYLNGREILRRMMPDGEITYATFAAGQHEGGALETYDLSQFVGYLSAGTNVLAVEAHQVNATSSDLVMDIELSGSTESAVVTRGPYLQVGTPTSVAVRWRTDAAVVGRVRYGASPNALDAFVEEAGATTEHIVTLANLSPDTKVYYAVGTGNEIHAGGDADHFVVTPPAPGAARSARIWVIGDSGRGNAGARAVRDAYFDFAADRDTDLWLMLGDNAYNSGTDAEYQAGVFDVYGDILRNSVLWPTRGNHDGVYPGPNNDYYDIFSMPTGAEAGGVPSGSEAYYSFDFGRVHFVCLDSEGSDRSPSGAMLTWLDADLAANTQDWTVAFWHHPPYTKGSHDSDNPFDSAGRMKDMRENALPILEEHGVDLVLTGHSHSYERSFLIDGHYGTSDTFADSMTIDGGDGSILGDGAYTKPTLGPGAHEGSIFAVAGSSATISGGSLDHPVMITSLNILGSMVVDVNGNQLDAIFLSDTGAILDEFTIVKDAMTGVAAPVRGAGALAIRSIEPNPARDTARIHYTIPSTGPVTVTVHDTSGRLVATVEDGVRGAGAHVATWDGRGADGRQAAAGVYVGRVRFLGAERAHKLVIMR
ncbi:MAG: metallophosphoesterase [bacterium]